MPKYLAAEELTTDHRLLVADVPPNKRSAEATPRDIVEVRRYRLPTRGYMNVKVTLANGLTMTLREQARVLVDTE